MDVNVSDGRSGLNQLPRLKALLKKYNYLKVIQTSLLQLSELAGSVNDMDVFYRSLATLLNKAFSFENFYIVLTDAEQQLALVYHHTDNHREIFERYTHQQWLQSPVGQAFLQQQPLSLNGQQSLDFVTSSDDLVAACHQLPLITLPLVRGSQVIGVFVVEAAAGSTFSERDSEVLSYIAGHLVTAIDRVNSRSILEQTMLQRTKKLVAANTQLQQEINERQKAEKLHKAMLAISELTASFECINTYYRQVFEKIRQIVAGQSFNILLFDGKEKLPSSVFYHNLISNFSSARIPADLVHHLLRTKQPWLITNDTLQAKCADQQLAVQTHDGSALLPSNAKTTIALPLIHANQVLGLCVINHYQHQQAFALANLDFMQFVAQHLVTAIVREQERQAREQNNRELERLVAERTKALQASNINLRRQVDERRKVEAQLYHDAHHDALTKLPNRALLKQRLEFALKQLKRYPNRRFAVLFIDLDRFKIINDTLGHHAGDAFLIEIAARLLNCIRENDILARLGGDEFVIMLESTQQQEVIEDIATRIIEAIEQPYTFDGNELYSGASIGIALCDQHYHDANEILRDADAAMYQAKSLGRGRYMFFDESMRDQLVASLTLEQELRQAVKLQQFELHFQQISNLIHSDTIGFEALLRWRHPEKGLLTPGDFLYLAEETGIILDIDDWVIEQACSQLHFWKSDPKYRNAFVAINLSGRHLAQLQMPKQLIQTIKQFTDEPERLILEFDELAFVQHQEIAQKALKQLKTAGVKLALDDYGTGLSSFNLVHNFPFEFIKLDRSFIRALTNNDKNLSLIKVLSELGEKFGYRLVAEGIESKELLAKVQAAGCEFGQGYYIDRPTKLSELKSAVLTSNADCA